MKITLIETGLVPEKIRDRWPGYPQMFADLLRAEDAALEFETVSVVTGEAFPDPDTLEAVLVTGSPSGVYDPEPWMSGLFDFIRWTASARVPMVGVCFGHQAIAHAMGGHAEQSSKGWGLGVHQYTVNRPPEWQAEPLDGLNLAVSHRDQVTRLPPGAEVLAGSDFTPNGVLSYDTAPILTLQPHPEFSDAYAADLYRMREHNPLTPEAVEEAIATLDIARDNDLLANWMVNFFRRNGRA